MCPLRLQEFVTQPEFAPSKDAEDVEEEGALAAYETGYAAGWEDAVAAQADAKAAQTAELVQHLRSSALDYGQARLHVLRAVEPLIRKMAEIVIPAIGHEVLVPRVMEILLPLAETAAQTPVRLRVAPGARDLVAIHLEGVTGLPLSIVEDATLSGGEVYVDTGVNELHLNLDAAARQVLDAVRQFFEIEGMERQDVG